MSRFSVGLVAALLIATASAVVAGNLLDRQQREVASVVRHYFDALQRGDLQAALQDLPADQRPRWRAFVNNLLRNDFDVQAVSVRSPSLLHRWLGGAPSEARSATIFVQVNPGTPDAWRAATLVPVERRGDRWYLSEPPLKPVDTGR